VLRRRERTDSLLPESGGDSEGGGGVRPLENPIVRKGTRRRPLGREEGGGIHHVQSAGAVRGIEGKKDSEN